MRSRRWSAVAASRGLDEQPLLPHLVMPAHHDVRPKDVMLRRLHGAIASAAESGPRDFADLLLVPGVGARTVRSLALVAEVVHGAPCRFADPARFSLAHGGKDRHPYPVPTAVYDKTTEILKAALAKAKLGERERLDAIRRLDEQTRRLRAHRHRPDPARPSSPRSATARTNMAVAASSVGSSARTEDEPATGRTVSGSIRS